ncbi:MAG: SRPBCC domain-containing protein [Canibacter sp.]
MKHQEVFMVPVGPVIARVRVALERAKVWELISTESGREHWLPGFTIGEGLGSDVAFHSDAHDLNGTIDVWVTGHVIGWKWARTDEGKDTAPLITLRSQDQNTTVTITETGFDGLDSGADHARQAQENWSARLETLAEYAGTAETDADAEPDPLPAVVSEVEKDPLPDAETADDSEPLDDSESRVDEVAENQSDEAEPTDEEAAEADASADEPTDEMPVEDEETPSEEEPAATEADEEEPEYDFDSDDGYIEGESAEELEPLMEPESHTNTGVITIPHVTDEPEEPADKDVEENTGEIADEDAVTDAATVTDTDADTEDHSGEESEEPRDDAANSDAAEDAPSTSEIGTDHTDVETSSHDAVILPEPPSGWEEQRDPSIYTASVPTAHGDAGEDNTAEAESTDNEAAFSQLLRDATVEPEADHSGAAHKKPDSGQAEKRPWWRRR